MDDHREHLPVVLPVKGVLMKKIGAITVGQSPRVDVTPDIEPLLRGITLVQRGALDGMTKEELKAIEPEEGDYVLVSRLKDGTSVKMAEKHILPRIQKIITELNEEGMEAILMLCTGQFPHFESKVPLFYPQVLLQYFAEAVIGEKTLGVLTPDESQFPQSIQRWKENGVKNVLVEAVSPYTEADKVPEAAKRLKDKGADMIVLDCIGYSEAMKQALHEAVDIPAILGRTVAARFIAELYNEGKEL